MPTSPLQIAAPDGFNPDYSYWRQIAPKETLPSHATLTWTVRQGESWMFQSATGLFEPSAVAQNRFFEIEIFDAAGNDIYIATSNVVIGANGAVTCSAALGVNDGGQTASISYEGGIHLALPWLILPAGFSLRFEVGNEDVGDTWAGTSFAVIAATRVGPSDPGAGAEPTGPFLYVPGPETAVPVAA